MVILPRVTNKCQREYDRDLYKARHLMENFFARLKHYRGIATRYDKTARNFMRAIHLAATMVWLARGVQPLHTFGYCLMTRPRR